MPHEPAEGRQGGKPQHREDAQDIAVVGEIAPRIDEGGQEYCLQGQQNFTSPAAEKPASQEGQDANHGEQGKLQVAQEGIPDAQQDGEQAGEKAGGLPAVIEEDIVVEIHLP